MSLIHEALKKAEAQRHLGQAPTLNTPAFARRRRRRWLLPLVVLTIVLAGGYLAWSFWPVSQDAAADVAKTAATHVAPATLTPARTGTPAAGRKPPAAANAAASPKAPPGATLASIMKARQKHPAPFTGAPATNPAASARPQQKPVASTTAHASEPKVSAALPPSAAIKPLSKPAAARPVATSAPPANASTSALPLYWQLPYAERKDLPELKISMHVYAPNPADRFVIINGARQIEGDDLGNSMTLVAIRRNGIVVELNGKRFVVPNAAGQ